MKVLPTCILSSISIRSFKDHLFMLYLELRSFIKINLSILGSCYWNNVISLYS